MITKRFTFCILAEDGKDNFTLESLFTTTSDKEREELRHFLLGEHQTHRKDGFARNTRAIVVLHVDQKEHDKWQNTPGRNGLMSKPVKKGMVFKSGVEASGHIGLRHNEVTMNLSRCAATGENAATLRGVTFAYADAD